MTYDQHRLTSFWSADEVADDLRNLQFLNAVRDAAQGVGTFVHEEFNQYMPSNWPVFKW